MMALGDQHGMEPAHRVSLEAHVQLVQTLQVEDERAEGAVDFERQAVLPAETHGAGPKRPHRSAGEFDHRLDRVLDVDGPVPTLRARPPVHEDPRGGADGADLAHEEARKIDDVGGEVADDAAARLGTVVPPGVRDVRIDHRVVAVPRAEVPDLPEPSPDTLLSI